jgi:hypothetical protein
LNFAEILAPVGYTFYWSPVPGKSIDLSTAEKVRQHFGFGIWQQVKDKFLLAAGDKHTVGESGGEETHQMTVDEMPSHVHGMYWRNEYTLGGGGNGVTSNERGSNTLDHVGFEYMKTAGGSQPFNIMPPYEVFYLWKRIA